LAFNGYFRYNEHLHLNDPELNALVTFKKRFDNITGIVLVVAVLGVTVWIRSHG
jgi:hypothetical protein